MASSGSRPRRGRSSSSRPARSAASPASPPGELVVVAGELVHRGDGARWRTLGTFGPDGTPLVSPTGEVLRARHVRPTDARRFFLGELSHLVAGRWSTAH